MIDTIYRCEICGAESDNPIRWIVIHCTENQMTLFKWTKEAADAPNARHYCGESHAQVFISRWFESSAKTSRSEPGEVIEFTNRSIAGVKQQAVPKP
ncbi:MAG: hypothetical protein ACP5FH_09795 [Terracidiphilus sp.]